MEPEGSLPHSQEPVICPHPQPKQSSPYLPSHCLEINFNIIPPSYTLLNHEPNKTVIYLLHT
jgi:hypothetical protein